MLQDNNLQAVCSVTQMAAKLGLSRVRFYQLQKMGIFPKPVYLGNPEHPFYPLDLQQQCHDIRKTGIGLNGQPTIFYAPRKKKGRCSANQSEHKYEELADALRQMGLNVTIRKVKNAVNALYPEGLTQQHVEDGAIGVLYRYLDQRL
jgi:signal recognition particle subunit SEC65